MLLGRVEEGNYPPQFAVLRLGENDAVTCDEILKLLGWSSARIMLKSAACQTIDRDEALIVASILPLVRGVLTSAEPSSDFIICRDDNGFDRGASFLIDQHWRPFAP